MSDQTVVILATTPDNGLIVVSQAPHKTGHYQLPQGTMVGPVTPSRVNDILEQTVGTRVRVASSRPAPADIVHVHSDQQQGLEVYMVGFNSAMLLRIPPADTRMTIAWKTRLQGPETDIILPELDNSLLQILMPHIVQP